MLPTFKLAKYSVSLIILLFEHRSAAAMPTNAERTAKYRRRMCASKEDKQTLKERDRKNNAKYRQNTKTRVQKLENDIALYRDKLRINGVALPASLEVANNGDEKELSAREKATKTYSPPAEERKRMSKKELSVWRQTQRLERNRNNKANKTKKITLMKTMLSNLRDVCRVRNISLAEPTPSALTEKDASKSLCYFSDSPSTIGSLSTNHTTSESKSGTPFTATGTSHKSLSASASADMDGILLEELGTDIDDEEFSNSVNDLGDLSHIFKADFVSKLVGR